MNLQVITDLINSKIRNNPLEIDKSEHADVEQEIVNEVYKTEIYDNNSKGLIVNEIDANNKFIQYQILFKKIGKTVFFNGTVFTNNASNSFFPPLKIKNSEYFVVDNHDSADNVYDVSICLNNRYETGKCTVFKDAGGSSETVIAFDFQNNNYIKSITFNGSYQSKT